VSTTKKTKFSLEDIADLKAVALHRFFEYETSGGKVRLLYKGIASVGTLTTAESWVVTKFYYDSVLPTQFEMDYTLQPFAWSNRASLSWPTYAG